MELIATHTPCSTSPHEFTLSHAVYTLEHRPGILCLAYTLPGRGADLTTFHNVPQEPFAEALDNPEAWREMEAEFCLLMPGRDP